MAEIFVFICFALAQLYAPEHAERLFRLAVVVLLFCLCGHVRHWKG